MFGGMDTHKDTLAVALIDPSGKRRDAITVANTAAGHDQLVAWLTEHGPVERLGIEGAGSYGRAVALALLAAGVEVAEVPPALTMRRRAQQSPTRMDQAHATAARHPISGSTTPPPTGARSEARTNSVKQESAHLPAATDTEPALRPTPVGPIRSGVRAGGSSSEHTFRFLKPTLGWTRPHIRTPDQADRWTGIIVAAHTQLRLARHLARDLRRPWEKPATKPHRLVSCRGRVRVWWRRLPTGSVRGCPAWRRCARGGP